MAKRFASPAFSWIDGCRTGAHALLNATACLRFRAAFIQASATTDETPNFENWRGTGAQALVTGRVEESGGVVRVAFRLWDVLPQQQLQGTAYTTNLANWRRIAHIMSDVIYERLLGEKGYFDTRIAYVSGTGPRDRRTAVRAPLRAVPRARRSAAASFAAPRSIASAIASKRRAIRE